MPIMALRMSRPTGTTTPPPKENKNRHVHVSVNEMGTGKFEREGCDHPKTAALTGLCELELECPDAPHGEARTCDADHHVHHCCEQSRTAQDMCACVCA